MLWRRRGAITGGFGVLLVAVMLTAIGYESSAQQQRRQKVQPAQPLPAVEPAPKAEAASAPEARNQPLAPAAPAEPPKESVQADVSTRQVAVTSSFTGTEIVVFGAVDNSRQESPEAGLYDIVIVLEGTPTRIVSRRKSHIAGLWINTQAVEFQSVPSYYAIASTRPLDEVADESVLKANDIGFEHVRMVLAPGQDPSVGAKEIKEFQDAVVRIKTKEGLYQQQEYGVVFSGRSLFRATIGLPANVTVGPFDIRVHLLRDGMLLSQYTARVRLERAGLERLLHGFAFGQPLLYGIMTVLIAVAAGLLASTLFRKGGH